MRPQHHATAAPAVTELEVVARPGRGSVVLRCKQAGWAASKAECVSREAQAAGHPVGSQQRVCRLCRGEHCSPVPCIALQRCQNMLTCADAAAAFGNIKSPAGQGTEGTAE